MKLFNQLVSKVHNKIQSFEPLSTSPVKSIKLQEISSQLYHCKYPQNIGEIKTLNKCFNSDLKSDKKTKIQIWNLSQYAYPQSIYQSLKNNKLLSNIQIKQLNYEFYTTMPITTVIHSVKQIQKYIISDSQNVVVVHCQENMSRSILFFVSYFCLTNKVTDAADGLNLVLERMKAKLQKTQGSNIQQKIFGSQHHILRHIINYHKDNSCINKNYLKLQKIIINPYPIIKQITFPLPADKPQKALLQIRKQNKVIYKKFSFHPLQSLNQFLKFNFNNNKQQTSQIIIHDDCLFTLKYVHDSKVYPVLRFQLNTNFIYGNFCRVPMAEMDIVDDKQKNERYIFADLFFEQVKQTCSQLAKLQQEGISSGVNYQKMLQSIKLQQQQKQQLQKQNKKQQNEDLLQMQVQAPNKNEPQQIDLFDQDVQNNFDEDQAQKHLNSLLTKLKVKEKLKLQQIEQIRKQQEQQEQRLRLQQQELENQQKQQQLKRQQELKEVKNLNIQQNLIEQTKIEQSPHAKQQSENKQIQHICKKQTAQTPINIQNNQQQNTKAQIKDNQANNLIDFQYLPQSTAEQNTISTNNYQFDLLDRSQPLIQQPNNSNQLQHKYDESQQKIVDQSLKPSQDNIIQQQQIKQAVENNQKQSKQVQQTDTHNSNDDKSLVKPKKIQVDKVQQKQGESKQDAQQEKQQSEEQYQQDIDIDQYLMSLQKAA